MAVTEKHKYRLQHYLGHIMAVIEKHKYRFQHCLDHIMAVTEKHKYRFQHCLDHIMAVTEKHKYRFQHCFDHIMAVKFPISEFYLHISCEAKSTKAKQLPNTRILYYRYTHGTSSSVPDKV